MYLVTRWFGTFLCDENGIKSKILFPKDPEDIAKRLLKIDIIHAASIILAEKKVEKKLKSEDLQVIQMINALDDLIQTSNLLSERMDCWSVIPTPEKKIKPFENLLFAVNDEIKRLEMQIECDVRRVAPNISEIAGSLISARLMSLAGGMERLACMPASTVQLLGAEGGKPPKHGVIFQHPLINRAPRRNRGKIARILAAKIAIAAKADVFTKRNISDDLKEDMNRRIRSIGNL
jgi:nucleolar protein 56